MERLWRQGNKVIPNDRYSRYRQPLLSVFQVVKTPSLISNFYDAHNDCFSDPMRLSWPQHLEVSRTVELAGKGDRGTAMALMGISLLMLLEDLLDAETPLHPSRSLRRSSGPL